MVRPRPLTKFCKKLRNSQTDAEKRLWFFLRKSDLGVKFRRQFAIGDYIVDFCSLEKRVVIELDGGQHQQSKEADVARDKFLVERGYSVLRFWNHDVLENTKSVLEKIYTKISPTQPPPKSRNPDGFVHVCGAIDGSVFTGAGEESNDNS